MSELTRERALAMAYESLLARVLTEPLSKGELAEYFDIHRTHVNDLLATLKGLRRVGTRFRVRIVDMPPAYWLRRGLIQARECRKLSEVVGFGKQSPVGSIDASRIET
ncbi:MAG TPA: hypothetical protein VFG04_08895 [Planctomycetaceae bacterium]|nr:hypothetical protein [Planctomycetaceae bacterium]